MPKFRKKPVVVEAVQLDTYRIIHTLEGDMAGHPGDWLITGVKGEQYPCKPEIFDATYEPADAPTAESVRITELEAQLVALQPFAAQESFARFGYYIVKFVCVKRKGPAHCPICHELLGDEHADSCWFPPLLAQVEAEDDRIRLQ